MSEQTNWWEWDSKAKKYSFEKTKQYVWGKHNDAPGKRIDDMSRDELIQVIATGYYDREQLAKALISVFEAGDMSPRDLENAIHTARLVVSKLEKNSLVWVVSEEEQWK